MTKEDLLAIRDIMREELQPIKDRLDTLEENQEEIRTGVNTLLDWAERSTQKLEFPLPKVIE